jgi:nanoRNase/pAp phosphatase (c-di-AMP/oligoRNAs hydrolase)
LSREENVNNDNCGAGKATGFCLDSFFDWAGGRGNILIVIHDHPDPDSLASAMALRHLFTMKLNRDAAIVFSGAISRSENVTMTRELEICLTPLEAVNLSEYKVVCMVDTQPCTGNNSLPPGVRVDVVIDHHPMRAATRECKWTDVRECYGATATILYEYLVASDIAIGTKLATALFYAIKSETQDLGREAGKEDRNAYLRLFPVTNKKLLYEITHPRLSFDHFRAIYTALGNARMFGSVLVISMGGVASPEILSEMADFLVRLEGIEAALSMGWHDNGISLSLRTNRHDLNAGDIMRKLVAGQGTAGGHGMTAGGRIEKGIVQASVEELEGRLTISLLNELGICQCEPCPLIVSR